MNKTKERSQLEPKYKRILIKLSGEALAGERGVGIENPADAPSGAKRRPDPAR